MKLISRCSALLLIITLLASVLCAPAAAVRPDGTEQTDTVLVAVRGGFVEVPASSLPARRAPALLGLPGADAVYSFGFNSDPAQEGWTFVNQNPDYSRGWEWDDPKADNAAGMKVFEGTGCIYSLSHENQTSSALKPDNWAVSPAVTLPAEGVCTVSFWAIAQQAFYSKEYFAVYAGTTANVNEMTRVSPAQDFRANPDGEYHRYTADLTAFAGQTVYVAIRHYNSTNQFALVIDAVEISSAPYPMVLFDPNGGTVDPAYFPVTEGSLSSLPTPVREGYIFAGWYDNLTGGSSVCAGVPITGTVTALARWIAQSKAVCGSEYRWDFNDDASLEGWTLADPWSRGDAADGIPVTEGSGVLAAKEAEQSQTTAPALTPLLTIPYGKSEMTLIARTEGLEPAALTVIARSEDGTEQQLGNPLSLPVGNYGSFRVDLSALAGQSLRLGFRTEGIVQVDLLELWGHAYQQEITPPSCTEQGFTTFTCSRCGDCFIDDYVGALDHDWSEWIEETAPTCTEEGEEYRVCSRCDLTETRTVDPLGHAWGRPIYLWAEDNGTVTARRVCGNDESHVETETVVTIAKVVREPTYTADGEMRFTAVFTNPAFAAQTKTVPIPKPVNPFSDVLEKDYFYTPVLWAYYHDPQITSGTDDTHFGPKINCTREQIVTFLWKAAGAPDPESAENPFTDVKPGKYYEKAILWAVEKKITSGMGDGTFGVGKPCTREQVVTFLWKAAGAPSPTTTECRFKDVKSGKYYYNAVLWAAENQITSGMSEDTFGVGTTCTRAQVVTFLYAAFGKNE